MNHIRVSTLLLALVVVAGFTLRTWNINFDQGLNAHPDERSTTCFVAPTIGLPQSWNEFRDPQRSPLNPLWNRAQGERRSYTYGHFPLYLGVAMGNVFHHAAPLAERVGAPAETVALMSRANTACDGLAVAGRLVIALLDTLTIVLVYLLGATVLGRWSGLLAAAFYAFTAQAIQLSHFFTMDPASTTFTVLAVLGGVTMLERRSYWRATLCGVGVGLAVASKFSALPVLAVPVTAGVLVYWQASRAAARSQAAGRAQFFAITGVLWALVIGFVAFAVTSPYALLDWQNFSQATLVEQGRMVRGVADFPFTRQYRNTTPYLYFIEQQVAWGLWWPLGMAALAGSLAAFALLIRTLVRLGMSLVRQGYSGASAQPHPGPPQVGEGAGSRFGEGQGYSGASAQPHPGAPQFEEGVGDRLGEGQYLSRVELANVVVWAWVLPYFGITGAFLAKFNRYMSPILPFAVLFAAGVVWALWQWGRRGLPVDSADVPADRGSRFEWRDGWRVVMRPLAVVVATVALAGGMFWSVAYVNGVYGREHTWITASRWIYENAPPGSVILWELWDDPLPKALPGEPDMNRDAQGLRNIDWSPYEEDTYEKYLTLRERLREADFVAYSSKRIYASVAELPQRYPMTIRYYQGMWDGSLGYELAVDVTSPPLLFGLEFEDRHADESWSLYDHPQVTIFRKVRELSDAEFDAYFDQAWEDAVHHYRGQDSFLSPFLDLLGLGRSPSSERSGFVGRLIGMASGESDAATRVEEGALMLDRPLAELPLVDNYRWNVWAGDATGRTALVWWAVLWLLGVLIWPVTFRLLSALRDRGYLLSRSAGWLAGGWLLWIGASSTLWLNTVRNAWLVLLALAVVAVFFAYHQRRAMAAFLRTSWPVLLVGELLFAAAFIFFLQLRVFNPDLWQPWLGGEKFMEFAFLNGILRSPTFPPVNPHFAGGYINYYYYGLYLVAFMVKLTGIYAEVAFNLAVASLFGLTVLNAFAVAYSFAGRSLRVLRRRAGMGTALLAAGFVALIGNLDGFAQLIRIMTRDAAVETQGIFGFVPAVAYGLWELTLTIVRGEPLPAYDFWAPSRVIPYTINEFPYWTFLFADLHPHMIAIPFCLLFLGGVVQLLRVNGGGQIARRTLLVAGIGLGGIVGTLAAINLWEYPTYLGLGLLLFWILSLAGRASPGGAAAAGITMAVVSYLLYLPFFRHYSGVGASGIGFVREPDEVAPWLLIWGFFLFIVASWLIWRLGRRPHHVRQIRTDGDGVVNSAERTGFIPELGLSRLARLTLLQLDRLPRMIALCSVMLRQPTFGFLMGVSVLVGLVAAAIVALLFGYWILTICLAGLMLSAPLLLRANIERELSTVFVALLTFTGFAILAGTQVIYVRDFLQGGESFRMNTLFKFFNQVWVLWGLAAGIAFAQLWRATRLRLVPAARARAQQAHEPVVTEGASTEAVAGFGMPLFGRPARNILWRSSALLLLIATLAFPIFGTPARLANRMVGWRPPIGTIDGMAFMEQGSYTWPDDSHRIELGYDHAAIRWLLENVRGNLVIAESAEVDYYRAGGTRIASFTGLSGLMGKHEGEQRYGEQVGQRSSLFREFWETSDIGRTFEIVQELDIALVYIGQLERHQHPEGVAKIQQMAQADMLTSVYENERVIIYAFPGRLMPTAAGYYVPARVHEDVGLQSGFFSLVAGEPTRAGGGPGL